MLYFLVCYTDICWCGLINFLFINWIDPLQRPPPPVTFAMSNKPWRSHTTHHVCSHIVKNTLWSKEETDKTEQVTSKMKQGLRFQIM